MKNAIAAVKGETIDPKDVLVPMLMVTKENVEDAELAKQGFYVTDLMGMGVNMLTGDYSRGAAGFWIEDGELKWPVSEVTIAGNLRDMLAVLRPADDLELRGSCDAPTVRIDGMTVAGR